MHNENRPVDCKPQTRINERVEILNSQTNEIERCCKELWEIRQQLSEIGKSINSVGHPDNLPISPNKTGVECLPEYPKTSTDGILGEIDRIIETGQRNIREFNNSLLPSLQRELEYLKEHI